MGKQTDLDWNNNRIQAMLWLRSAFPLLFSSQVKPLKIGIKQDIMDANLDGMPEKKYLHAAIGYYVRSTAYLRCMKAGMDRFDLQGLPSGCVTPEAATLARKTLTSRQKQWSDAAKQVKLAQRTAREIVAAEPIQTIPVVNDAPEVISGTKKTLTLKKKPLPELQDNE